MRFRLQALVHQGEPDELDLLPRLVRPRAWVAAAVLLVGLGAAVIWALVGDLPQTLTARGLLTTPAGVGAVQSPFSGVVSTVPVSAAQSVAVGDTVATVVDAGGREHEVPSPFSGRVVTVSVVTGQPIQAGTSLLTVERGAPGAAALRATLFVPAGKAAEVGPGMPVKLAVGSAPSVAFGLLRGRVTDIDPYPITPEKAQALLGNELLAKQFLESGAVQLVTVELQRDSRTRSGYAWTNASGPPFPLLPQTLLSGTVRVGDEHPMTLVFGR